MINSKKFSIYIDSILDEYFKNEAKKFQGEPTSQIDEKAIEKSLINELETLKIQKKTTSIAKKNAFGFDIAIKELEKIRNSSEVECHAIKSPFYNGRVILNKNDQSIIGFILIKADHKKLWETPPKWDGSEEMLKSFNTKDNFQD